MQLHYYIPFCFTFVLGKCLELLSGSNVAPGTRWEKYFSEGFTQENYCRSMNDMKNADPTTYWLMLVAPNAVACGIVLIILLIIIRNQVG